MIEDVATRLHGATIFTILDVRSGFWRVVLDEESSYLTTFKTSFGPYRSTRMSFRIRSAPEIFQREMYELIEGLTGIEVIGDDFVAVGFGESLKRPLGIMIEFLWLFLRGVISMACW